MRPLIVFSIMVVLFTVTTASSAVVIHVPADQPTIQAGIEAAAVGDTVLVADGTYSGAGNMDLDLSGKAITVRSASGPAGCIIDCQSQGRGFIFQNGEGRRSVVKGFTITRGKADAADTGFGAAIYSEEASPTIRENLISDNWCRNGGAAIYCRGGRPLIDSNTVSDNDGQVGTVIFLNESAALVLHNRIIANRVGGIGISYSFYQGDRYPLVKDNLINSNRGNGVTVNDEYSWIRPSIADNHILANEGSGVHVGGDSQPIINNNLIDSNMDSGISIDGGEAGAEISDCLIENNLGTDGAGISGSFAWITVTNCLIANNAATGRGGAVYNDSGNMWIRGCTIAGNHADVEAGAIWCLGHPDTVIIDSVIWDNSAPTGMEIFCAGEWWEPVVTISYSDLMGGQAAVHVEPGCSLVWGAGMIDTDPLFVSGMEQAYFLSQIAAGQAADSPCVDSGGPAAGPPWGSTRTDHLPDENVTDMGFHLPGLQRLITGPGPARNNPPAVRLFDPRQDALHELSFNAYGAPHYGVNVAGGNVEGYGISAVVTGAGPGEMYGPHVRGFSNSGLQLPGLSFLAYGTNRWGVNVACGDVDGDGYDEIVTGPGPGSMFGAHVRVFDYDGSGTVTPANDLGFFAYGTPRWGVNVACGDVDGDGYDEIVTGPGPGGGFGPHVRGWNMEGGMAVPIAGLSFMAYGTHRRGVNVTCGDLDGDGMDEIVTGPGPGSMFGAHIRGWNFDGSSMTAPMTGINFLAWPPAQLRYGAQVYAGTDLDGNGRDDLAVAAGPDPAADTTVKVYRYEGSGVEFWLSFEAYAEDGTLSHGVKLGGGHFVTADR